MVTAVLFNEPCFPFIAAPFMLDRECCAVRERKETNAASCNEIIASGNIGFTRTNRNVADSDDFCD